MCALGYFPTHLEIKNMTNEVNAYAARNQKAIDTKFDQIDDLHSLVVAMQ